MKSTMISGIKVSPFLRIFSKIVCYSTLFLIFVGSLVTSTGSGLAVPDWPLSYGTLFPPMVGGVFYEHGHRMVASAVGFLVLILAFCIMKLETRRWVKILGFAALGAVILQGLLGGLTVLLFLPTPVSVIHGVLAQTFFVITIVLAYALSKEYAGRISLDSPVKHSKLIRYALVFTIVVYLQLILGAIMRHTGSGLAIPDVPTMGGQWWPTFDDKMLSWINYVRFDLNLDPVTLGQVAIHFCHRLMAGFIFIFSVFLTIAGLKEYRNNDSVYKTILALGILICVQVGLGILTVLTHKLPYLTSFHVVTGAATLGVCVLMCLRILPVRWEHLLKVL